MKEKYLFAEDYCKEQDSPFWKVNLNPIVISLWGNQDRPKLIPGGIYLSLAITNLINQLDIDMTLVAVNTQYPVLCGHCASTSVTCLMSTDTDHDPHQLKVVHVVQLFMAFLM